jgi:hypothetical protein
VQHSRISPSDSPERATTCGWSACGRLSIDDAVVEVDSVEVRRHEDVCQIECSRTPDREYVLVGYAWEVFIARVPLAAP